MRWLSCLLSENPGLSGLANCSGHRIGNPEEIQSAQNGSDSFPESSVEMGLRRTAPDTDLGPSHFVKSVVVKTSKKPTSSKGSWGFSALMIEQLVDISKFFFSWNEFPGFE